MKRMSYALMLCLVSIIIVGCNQNQPATTTTPTTDSTLDDSEGNCLVTLEKGNYWDNSCSNLSVIIKDKKGNQKGSGQLFGDYNVPHDGTIEISWTQTVKKNYGGGNYENIAHYPSCSIPVGSANALKIRIDLNYSGNIAYLYVGDQLYQEWDYSND